MTLTWHDLHSPDARANLYLRALRKRLEPNVTTLTGWLLSPANNLASAI